MIIETSRFGQLEVDERRLIDFADGILGFPEYRRFALIQTGQDSGFYWLQSTECAGLAFVVTDPRLFVADYRVPVRGEELERLGLDSVEGAQVFIIVNKVDGMLTGNLQGPLVINVATRAARQSVLSDQRYSTRHPLTRIPAPETLARTG
ncbi:MAG TPA: flagellar assembly protein FliW [Phycisphaerae bacterium]|nr:flagellar assembly protein FliW [Phycisphaerae bacterium]